jgi:hypothetical protein
VKLVDDLQQADKMLQTAWTAIRVAAQKPPQASELELQHASVGGHTNSSTRIFLAIDVEGWEKHTETVLEVGICVCLGTPTPKQTTAYTFCCRHFIVEENMHHRNGKYVPDHKDHFLFGDSEVLSTEAIAAHIKKKLQRRTSLLVCMNVNSAAFFTHHTTLDVHSSQPVGCFSARNLPLLLCVLFISFHDILHRS